MIRTRFCPSPTGLLHLGNARTALFSALFAAEAKGVFLLRIEDTDAVRSEAKFSTQLQEDLLWLGLEWQEGPGVGGPESSYFQSERADIYEKYYQQLEKQGMAYPCFCSEETLALNRKIQLSQGKPPRYAGTCRQLSDEKIQSLLAEGKKPVLRFAVRPDHVIQFVDVVKGQQQFKTQDIGDFIIRRADGSASFLFCNAIDDALMGVTHVLRGEDHLSNTPRQLLILQALDLNPPQYGHFALITNDDGSRLSKRDGCFSLNDLRAEGYLSQVILNYLARLGHSYDNIALLSFAELAQAFHLSKIAKSSARFDHYQLLHWQKEAVTRLSETEFFQWIGKEITQKIPEAKRVLFFDIMRQQVLFPSEVLEWANILFGLEYELTENALLHLQSAGVPFFTSLNEAVTEFHTDFKVILETIKFKTGLSGKKLYMPIRVAVTGEEKGPELAPLFQLLGQEKIQERLAFVIDKLKEWL